MSNDNSMGSFSSSKTWFTLKLSHKMPMSIVSIVEKYEYKNVDTDTSEGPIDICSKSIGQIDFPLNSKCLGAASKFT